VKKLGLLVLICALLLTVGAQTAGAAPPRTSPIVHIVQWGENLTGIAARYGVSIQAIVNYNGLASANRIYVGQRLLIPVAGSVPAPAPIANCTYVVQFGDNLTGIAYRSGVSVATLVAINNLVNPNMIYVGQRLALPCAHVPPPAPPPAPWPVPVPSPSPTGQYYVVQWKDTLAKIAYRFGVSVWSIVQANNIANPNVIYPGQKLFIPGTAPVEPAPTPPPGCEHLTQPRSGDVVKGTVTAKGTADIPDFAYYKLEQRKDGLDGWHWIMSGTSPVQDGTLGTWDTRTVPDGDYFFRLVIVDGTGNYPPPCEIILKVRNDP
jgi:LysM repeat protein